jgi:hypothetical protein
MGAGLKRAFAAARATRRPTESKAVPKDEFSWGQNIGLTRDVLYRRFVGGPNRRHVIAWQSPLWWKLYALFTFHPYISKMLRPRRRIR